MKGSGHRSLQVILLGCGLARGQVSNADAVRTRTICEDMMT